MDEKKKQILLLSVLGVLVLGAGSYYLFLRDTGPTRRQSTTETQSKGRERRAPVKTQKKQARKAARKPTKPKAREDTARVRTPTKEKKESKGRQRKRGSTEKKKKKLTPMA